MMFQTLRDDGTWTTEYSFEGDRQAICVSVEKSDSSANLFGIENFGINRDWFLFRK